MKRLILVIIALLAASAAACAQTQSGVPPLGDLLQGTDAPATGRIVQYVALLTVLSLAPSILIMATSFTRFIVAFSFLRSSLGLPSTPANIVIITLALFLTFFVMAPVFDQAWRNGVQPLIENRITEQQAYAAITDPFREFMLTHVREKDLALFTDLAASRGIAVASPEQADLRTLVPAFMISELRRGFEIGFLIALPFLIIDLIVATITMSMGMMMMPPTVISLPFKVLFFVLIDGWSMLAGSLVKSFA
jgi:flagellar biosynthetic protein FliP